MIDCHDRQVASWEARLKNPFSQRRDYQEGANAYAHQQLYLVQTLRDRHKLLYDAMQNILGDPNESCDDDGDDDLSSSCQLSEVLLSVTSDGTGSCEDYICAEYEEDVAAQMLGRL